MTSQGGGILCDICTLHLGTKTIGRPLQQCWNINIPRLSALSWLCTNDMYACEEIVFQHAAVFKIYSKHTDDPLSDTLFAYLYSARLLFHEYYTLFLHRGNPSFYVQLDDV